MGLLIAGVALWWAAHLFKRVAPEARAGMGDKAKGLVALLLVGAIVLMVVGYRAAPTETFLWATPSWGFHANNLLVLIAIFLMSPAPKRGRLLNGMRHPMLAGFGLWALGHLIVNGDLPSVILFGGLLLWVPVAMLAINRAEPVWTAPEPGSLAKDAMFLVASVVLMAVIGYIHGWIGPSPFGG